VTNAMTITGVLKNLKEFWLRPWWFGQQTWSGMWFFEVRNVGTDTHYSYIIFLMGCDGCAWKCLGVRWGYTNILQCSDYVCVKLCVSGTEESSPNIHLIHITLAESLGVTRKNNCECSTPLSATRWGNNAFLRLSRRRP
jgi:hypothetical protein